MANLSREQAAPRSEPEPKLTGVPFELLSEHAETYELKVGAKPFTDRGYVVLQLAKELARLSLFACKKENLKDIFDDSGPLSGMRGPIWPESPCSADLPPLQRIGWG